jgi:hypothetical protein
MDELGIEAAQHRLNNPTKEDKQYSRLKHILAEIYG